MNYFFEKLKNLSQNQQEVFISKVHLGMISMSISCCHGSIYCLATCPKDNTAHSNLLHENI